MSCTAPAATFPASRPGRSRRERGLSIVELLVAMVIGLFLIGGVVSVFVANQQSAAAKRNFDNSQEALRFMAATVGRIVRLGTAVEATSTASQLVVTYPGGAGVKNCLGVAVAGTQTDTFTRSGNELRCNGTTLLDGLSAVSFSYGVDANGNDWIEAGEYVTAPADWTAVNSVRVTATLASGVAHTFTTTLRPKLVALHSGAQPAVPPPDPGTDPGDGESDIPVNPGEGEGDQGTDPTPPTPPPPVVSPPPTPTTCANTVQGTTGQYNVTTSPAGSCTYSGNGSNRTFVCTNISAAQGSTITVIGTRTNGNQTSTIRGTATANCGSQTVTLS